MRKFSSQTLGLQRRPSQEHGTQNKACLLSTASPQNFALNCRRRQGHFPVTHELWLSYPHMKSTLLVGGYLTALCLSRQTTVFKTDMLSPVWLELLWHCRRGKKRRIHFLLWLKVTGTNKKDDRLSTEVVDSPPLEILKVSWTQSWVTCFRGSCLSSRLE